jgi:hypothetical protein
LNPTNEIGLRVGLPEFHLDPQLARAVTNHPLDVQQRCMAIDLRFPLAEQVQIRAIEE